MILGEPASKHNSRRRLKLGKRTVYAKSDKAYAFSQSARLQIPVEARVMFAGPVAVTLHVFYANRRSDLDDTIICDVLQAEFLGPPKNALVCRRGVYLNDRQIVERHVYKHIDRKNPRVHITVEERLEWQL